MRETSFEIKKDTFIHLVIGEIQRELKIFNNFCIISEFRKEGEGEEEKWKRRKKGEEEEKLSNSLYFFQGPLLQHYYRLLLLCTFLFPNFWEI